MEFKNNISELIKKRKSVRTYETKEIDGNKLIELEKFINNIEGPFNAAVRFKIINSKEEVNGGRLGTYGVIKGTNYYIGAAVKKSEFDLEELGYEMEAVILFITGLGLGSCWVGGTFKRGQFGKVMETEEDEIFPIIVPIGFPAEKQRTMEKLMRYKAKADKRKEWNELFYLRDFSSPLTKFSTLGSYKDALENVRLAPSAVNMQPWRIIKKDNKFHFYKEGEMKNYNAKLGYDMQKIDMGIAMCHFDLTCRENGLKGKFIVKNPDIKGLPENIRYMITWTENKL